MSYEFQDQVLGMVIYQHKRYWPLVKNKWNPKVFVELDRIKLAEALEELLNSEVEFNNTVLIDKLNGHASIMLINSTGNYTREVNIIWFLDQLIAWHNLRSLVPKVGDICQEILQARNIDKPERIITKFKNIYDESENSFGGSNNFFEMKEMLDSTMARIEQRIIQRIEGKPRGYSFGLQKLDDYMQGLIPGRFYIIAARTSVGKTSFATWLALHAIKQGAKPLFFSNEMDKEDLIEKFIALETKIGTQKFQSGDLTDFELSKLTSSVNDLAKRNIVIDENAGWDIDTLLSTAHKLNRLGKCNMVFVDYLQQVKVKSAKSKYEQVSHVSDEMKRLSRELKIPVIGLAQINREAEKGPTKEVPGLSNLKDSGSLEQDADVVMILHKNDIADEEVIMNIGKNRYGQTGAIKLRHIHKFNSYESML